MPSERNLPDINWVQAQEQALRQNVQTILDTVRANLVGRDCRLRVGKFRGRRARITDILLDYNASQVLVQAAPYSNRVNAPLDELLSDHKEGRCYRPLAEVEL
jgi:hypothetical protein